MKNPFRRKEKTSEQLQREIQDAMELQNMADRVRAELALDLQIVSSGYRLGRANGQYQVVHPQNGEPYVVCTERRLVRQRREGLQRLQAMGWNTEVLPSYNWATNDIPRASTPRSFMSEDELPEYCQVVRSQVGQIIPPVWTAPDHTTPSPSR